eukprot:458668-Amphidinium_carterae.1
MTHPHTHTRVRASGNTREAQSGASQKQDPLTCNARANRSKKTRAVLAATPMHVQVETQCLNTSDEDETKTQSTAQETNKPANSKSAAWASKLSLCAAVLRRSGAARREMLHYSNIVDVAVCIDLFALLLRGEDEQHDVAMVGCCHGGLDQQCSYCVVRNQLQVRRQAKVTGEATSSVKSTGAFGDASVFMRFSAFIGDL